MSLPEIKVCPGSLRTGFQTYSRPVLNRLFNGKQVGHILSFDSPYHGENQPSSFVESLQQMSISGVQEKFSVRLDGKTLRLIKPGEQGQYILKPQPRVGKLSDQMPANEHLTMQLAKQVYQIETAENALIFFKNGEAAYLTKRFDVLEGGGKRAQEDFAALAQRSPQTHGEDYKYQGNYLEFFQLLKRYVPAYTVEAPKLFRVILFNYLFSNGDAHFKNCSLLQTDMGDFRLSPAYDLLNSRLHIYDQDFALAQGLLPPALAQGKLREQFYQLAALAEINPRTVKRIFESFLSQKEASLELIENSFLSPRCKRSYQQAYLSRWNKLTRA